MARSLRRRARLGQSTILRLLRAGTMLCLMLASEAFAAQAISPVFLGVEVYGTDRFGGAAVHDEFAREINQFVALIAAQAADSDEEIREIQHIIEERLRRRGPFVYVDVSFGATFVPPGTLELRLSVDIVEEEDRARRMPFRSPPTGTYADPDGLFSLFNEYQANVMDLGLRGALEGYVPDCPVLHCVASFQHPVLRPYLSKFNEGARRREDLLYEIAEASSAQADRQSAFALLAHTNDANRLLPALARAIYDPDDGVRNSAMRVMLFIAQQEPERDYPISDLIAALDFPNNSDRNKAASALLFASASAAHREIIRAQGLSSLLRLLRTDAPPTHYPAYELLKRISGEDYGPRDYAAWEAWCRQQERQEANGCRPPRWAAPSISADGRRNVVMTRK